MTHDTNIPQGYKATALGIIPQEWEVMRLGDIVSITSGESPSLYHLKAEGKYPYVKVEDLNNCEKYQESSREYSDDNNTTIKAGSIIFPKRGASILNNKVRIAAKDIQMDSNMMAITPHTAIIDTEFLYIRILHERLYRIADTSSIPQINNKHIIPYKIAVPPLAEQRKIAEVLGVWDEAIEKQARLIEKLALRKRALMQRLLSAKHRLPGFSEPWKKVKLGDVASIKTGNKNNEDKIANGQYPFFVRSSIVERINTYSYDGEAILIPGEGKIGEIIHYINGKFDYHQRVYKISDFSNCSGLFLYYYLMYFFGKQAINNSVKACVDSLRLSTFTNMTIIHPPISEQTAIAEVLTAADREIELAKEKLERLRRQKRGLMQQLLTGKKRI